MCGVIGLLIRDRALEPQLGSMLVTMIEALDERGPDSSGIAVYADDRTGDTPYTGRVKVSLGSDEPVDWGRLAASLEDRFGEAVRPVSLRWRAGARGPAGRGGCAQLVHGRGVAPVRVLAPD
jgi:asparagine synthetase B (glutamine-hydrolysing)